MTLIANRPLKSTEYGRVNPGERFDVQDPDVVKGLVSQGLASIVPISTYETKVIVAAPVVAAPPFRDLYMPHASEQGEVSSGGTPVLSGADVSEQGTPDPPRRKRGRPRKHL